MGLQFSSIDLKWKRESRKVLLFYLHRKIMNLKPGRTKSLYPGLLSGCGAQASHGSVVVSPRF